MHYLAKLELQKPGNHLESSVFKNGGVFFGVECVEAKSILQSMGEYSSSKFNLHFCKTKLISKQYVFNLRLEKYFYYLSHIT